MTMNRTRGWWWQSTILAILLAGIGLAAGSWKWGSLNEMNAYLHGRYLALDQSVIDLGERPAEDVTLTFKLENLSGGNVSPCRRHGRVQLRGIEGVSEGNSPVRDKRLSG